MSKDTSLRRISIRSVRKSPPDLSKLGRALIQLAIAQAESEARTQTSPNDTNLQPSSDANAEDESGDTV